MADQRAAWNFDGLGDDVELVGNDNTPPKPSAEAYVVKNIDQVKQSLVDGHRHVGESRECVALVKHFLPEVGRAANWRQGTKINGYNDPPLEPGTAIATFHNGKYQNNATGNHAAIFLKYDEEDGKKGIRVLEQYNTHTPKERLIPFDSLVSQSPSNHASSYSVIRKPSTK